MPQPTVARASMTRRSRRSAASSSAGDGADVGGDVGVRDVAAARTGSLRSLDDERRRAGGADPYRLAPIGRDLPCQRRVVAIALPGGEVEAGDLLGDPLQERSGHVAGSLLALLAVKGFDVVPHS